MTENQQERQKHRSSTGRYNVVNPCEVGGKSAGVDYFSLEDCNETGFGVMLCVKCAAKIMEGRQ